MEVIDAFANTHIDLDDEKDTKHDIGQEDQKIPTFINYMVEHKVLDLKNKFIHKGLVPLQQLFDRNGVHVKPIVLPKDNNIEEYNIGTEKNLKYIKLSKNIHDD
jgi:hypothetical protein